MSPNLDALDAQTFEHMINMLALSVLGAGHTGFAPGADGGRDGYFEGMASYPSEAENWSGTWYIQCKFHKPHLSKDPQKWLLEQIKAEIKTFGKNPGKRRWPDNYILATNINPTAVATTGTFDKARALIAKARPKLKNRFHIWGGQKIVDLLSTHPNVREQYGHFLTPGHVITSLYNSIADAQSSIKDIIRYLVIKEFETQQFTKLDQAGSEADTRPGVHKLFVDLPYKCLKLGSNGLVAGDLFNTSKRNHKPGEAPINQKWSNWQNYPTRARIWFIQGGPGQGKSTSGQYFAQVQRAALILDWAGDPIHPKVIEAAEDIKKESSSRGHWHDLARIPITVDLKEYAQWFGKQPKEASRGVLQFVTSKISCYTGKATSPETLKRALRSQRWFVAFDGLDEVPNDVKDPLSTQIKDFINDISFECNSDTHFICTSRPQGYSGQFDDLDCAVIRLAELTAEKALECAIPVIRIGRTEAEAEKGISILKSAIRSPAVRALMTTPLQSHIMAVVVRDGKKPPERRWQLFENFYQVIKRRETNRDLPDQSLARLLREEEQLLRSIHNKLGFVLHAKAETSTGAQTSLSRPDFRVLAQEAVSMMKDSAIEETVKSLMEATSTRLVLLNTPDDGGNLRFDIRQLQEFFAAEYIHDAVDHNTFRRRVTMIAGDSHWREVMHFLLSAMIEPRRITEIGELVVILEQLDSGSEEDDNRALKRRLARGALLTARLLQDGVLEQDKQIRFRFRTAVEPLMASLDVFDLDLLATIEHPDSRRWIVDYSMERLKEGDDSETVGAAYLLSRLLHTSDALVPEVLIMLKSKPVTFRSEFLRKCNSQRNNEREAPPPAWLSRFALSELQSSTWHELDDDSIQSGIHLAKHLVDSVDELSQIPMASVVRICLKFLRSERAEEAGQELVNYGFMAKSQIAYSWKNGRFSDKELDSSKPNPERSPYNLGFLDIIYNIFVFSRTHSIDCYIALSHVIKNAPGRLEQILPHNLHGYIPTSIKARDKDTSTEGFQEAVMAAEAPSEFNMIDPVKFNVKSAELVVDAHPWLGVRMLVEGWFQPIDTVSIDDTRSLLGSRVAANTALLEHINILHWGHFIDFQNLENHATIELLNKWANGSGSNVSRFLDISPIKLSSKKHATLIPSILISLLYLSESRREQAPWEPQSASRGFGTKEISAYLAQFFPAETNEVQRLNNPHVDGFLALFSLLHPHVNRNIDLLHTEIASCFALTKDQKLIQATLAYAQLPARCPHLDGLITKLLEACRTNFRLRTMFIPLLRQWREVSSAPISSFGNLSSL